jgi:hypothetical protein
MVLPIAEIRDEILANFTRRVLAGVGVKALPIPQRLERSKANGEKHSAVFAQFSFPRLGNFRLHPFALHAMRRKDEQEPVVDANGFVDLLVNLFSTLNLMGRKPAADAFVLKIGMEPLGKLLIFGGVADEAGIELDGLVQERWQECYEVVRKTATPEKGEGERTGFGKGSVVESAWSIMCAGFEPQHISQIHIDKQSFIKDHPAEVRPAEARPHEARPHEVRPAEVRLAEVCLAEVRPAEVRPAEVRPAEVRPAEVRPDEVRLAEVRPAEVRPAELCLAELCLAEVRHAEVRPAEVRLAEVCLYIGILKPPLIPRLNSLANEIKLLCVCHLENTIPRRAPNGDNFKPSSQGRRVRALERRR